MSNLGLERYLDGIGLGLARTRVGDRYVVEHMRTHGLNLGGEQSGHVVLRDHCATGDGLLAALQVLAELVAGGKPASEALALFEPLPQRLENVPCGARDPLAAPAVQQAVADAEARLNGVGRLLIRKSGTEPLIRIMAEAEDEHLVGEVVEGLAADIRAAV